MPDRIEEILKDIHVLFAKGESYQASPDRVVISKHEMFELLEELSEALYEVMDKYEATARSREKARLEMDRRNAETVEEAHRKADDVHAATLLYTDHMLDQLKNIIDTTRIKVKDDMLDMIARMEDCEAALDTNKSGVRDDLSELHDNELYLRQLEALRKVEEDKRRYGLSDEEAAAAADPSVSGKTNIVIRVDKPGTNSGVSVSTRRTRKKGRKNAPTAAADAGDGEQITLAEGSDDGAPVPSGTVFTADDFDLDAEYEQWKEGQETPAEGSGQPRPAGKLKNLFRALFK